ncbi:hypothetical protein WG66_016509, partial [Moniliophthora roreri]
AITEAADPNSQDDIQRLLGYNQANSRTVGRVHCWVKDLSLASLRVFISVNLFTARRRREFDRHGVQTHHFHLLQHTVLQQAFYSARLIRATLTHQRSSGVLCYVCTGVSPGLAACVCALLKL